MGLFVLSVIVSIGWWLFNRRRKRIVEKRLHDEILNQLKKER